VDAHSAVPAAPRRAPGAPPVVFQSITRLPPPLEVGPVEADRLALSLRSALDRIILPLARAARAFVGKHGWQQYGYARLDDFGHEVFQRSGRWIRDLASLSRSLDHFSALHRALTGDDDGDPIGWVAATWIGRIASRESIESWIDLARSLTARELRESIRAARIAGSDWPPGAGPASTATVAPTEKERVPEDRRTVPLPVPSPVRVAFDETLDLHRAVEGSEASVDSFVEALTAETFASGIDPDPAPRPGTRGPSRAERERAREAAGRELPGTDRRPRPVLEELVRLAKLERIAGEGSAADLLDQLDALIGLEESLQVRLGEVLAVLEEARAWRQLGFLDAAHYARERLRISPSLSEKRARLARALRSLPRLREAYELGWVGFESAQLVVQAVGRDPSYETEREWVSAAQCSSFKRLTDSVRIRRRSPTPRIGGPTSLPPDDAEWHASLRRAPGSTRERVRALGDEAVAGIGAPEPRPMVSSADAFLRLRLTPERAEAFLGAIEARRREIQERGTIPTGDDGSESAPELPDDAPASVRAAQRFSAGPGYVPQWVGLLALLEDYAETWDDPRSMPRRPADAVYIRDGWRCMAPGCTSRRNLEDHHVVYRSQGGSDELTNRACLCRFHHQQGEHGGLARVEGEAPLGLTWRLGVEELGRWYRNERRVQPPC
jgi:Domain of unknown function (DUF222)